MPLTGLRSASRRALKAYRLGTRNALSHLSDVLGHQRARRQRSDADAYVPPESNLEARLHALAKAAGIDTLVRQCDVVEVDSDLHHSSMVDEEDNTARDAGLAGAGFTVVRIKERDLWHRPGEVVRRLLAS